MPLNPDAVGATGDVRTMSWTSKDALLYAVGIGAGQADLQFTTENTRDVQQVVYPAFAVVAGSGTTSQGAVAMGKIGSFNWAMLVHGSQAITLHRPIPVEAQATVQDKVVAMYDKGKAAVVVMENEVKLASGEPLWTSRSSVFIRGEGGWGGDRGPSGPVNEPPADRAPDHQVTMQTGPDQAFVYRLSGDRNPLHTDPSFAALGGFDRPILHGLCTYGFTGRALLCCISATTVDESMPPERKAPSGTSATIWPATAARSRRSSSASASSSLPAKGVRWPAAATVAASQ